MSEKPAKTELAKSYSPVEAEGEIRATWERARAFHADAASDRPPYCILIPPPNVTAALHLGHAFNNTIQDILIRYHRMRGFNTLWMPGTDHAGIATQTVVEKRLMQTEGMKRTEYSREAFVAKVQAWKDEYEATIIEQLKAMGCSCDFDRTRFTMDEVCAKAVREAFFRLFKDGLIYRGKRLVNWDPVTQTALADDEVEMEEVQGKMYYLRYPLVDDDRAAKAQGLPSLGSPEFVTVATTRPETMLGDTAVAINPKDPRAAALRGKFVKLPIVGRVIPIIEDDYVVMPVQHGGDAKDAKAQFATGFLKVTPAHDPNDWDIGQRHNLPVINVMAPDATISDAHGWDDVSEEARPLVGLAREEARKKVIEWFQANNLYEGDREYIHSVGHSYRSHVPIEPYLSDQWYVRVTDDRMKGEALRAMAQRAENGSTGGTGILPVRTSGFKGAPDQLTIHRRTLPHWQIGGSTYFITFRVREGILTEEERQIVADACLHWHGARHHVHLATVMPDHVHMIMTPLQKDDESWHSLPKLMHSIKSHTARTINRLRGTSGTLWQDEYFDRIIRDEEEFFEKYNYMLNNPVKAELVKSPEEYAFTVRPADSHGQDARATDTEQQDARAAEHRGPDSGGPGILPGRGKGTPGQTRTGRMPVPPAPAPQRDGDGDLRFFPDRYAKTFQQWHENLRDWCISRQLWWGHRIPVWKKEGPMVAESIDIRGVPGDTSLDTWVGPVVAREYRDRISLQGTWDQSRRVAIAFICVRPGQSDIEQWLQENGWEQDPDVLDTWFSSGLWPLSTMGWPDPTAFPKEFPESARAGSPCYQEPLHLLGTFNPSSVLCTAREIITLWVSRMVMFNRYFRDGKLPFRHVYIHAMIQDGHGQKMSKSLGNSVDPRDIIHSHGADAMRFTLARLATATQDVRMPVDVVCPHCGETFEAEFITTPAGHRVPAPELTCAKCGKGMVSGYGAASGRATPTSDKPLARTTSRKFDEGRNFANKLWNAARFALGNLSDGSTGNLPVQPTAHGQDARATDLPLVDRWMLARLYRTAQTIEGAIGEYQLHHYADAMYDLVWREFCDWYLEAIKPTVRENESQQAVLGVALDAILRMLHPIMPFVTEAIWEQVREGVRSRKQVAGVELAPSDLCATAPWPVFDQSLDDPEAIAAFTRLQNLIESIRTIRGERNIPRKKLLRLAVGPEVMLLIMHDPTVVHTMAGLEGVDSMPASGSRPAGAIPIAFEGGELLLIGLVDESDEADIDAERTRLKKFIAEKERAISGFQSRLANANYLSKAPPSLVEETRAKLAEAEADREAARRALQSLEVPSA